MIVSGSVINTGTKIGEHCLINTSSSIDHDNNFKNFSSTGPRVTTGGNVKLGQCSHLGMGAVVKNQITIGDNTIVGSKSMVLKNCNKNSVYYGNARKEDKKQKRELKILIIFKIYIYQSSKLQFLLQYQVVSNDSFFLSCNKFI